MKIGTQNQAFFPENILEKFRYIKEMGFDDFYGFTDYLKAMELMGTNLENTVFIGDQLFTDVYGAKRTGMHNILVKPIHPKEEIQIVLKRKLEKIVLYFYRKELRRRKNS